MSEKNATSDGGDGSIIYSVGEKVLAYHGPRIYQAIVQRAEIRKNEWNYFVHYIDSSESSDEWVGIDRLMKEVDIGRVSVGLNNNVFGSISSIASHLVGLSLNIDRRLEDLQIDAIPALPNVKRLKLTLPTRHHDCLLEFIEIAKACPILETFIISLYWCSPNTRTKPWSDAIGHSFPQLKHFEIDGYWGQISDFQVALYMIGNAAGSLKKIVIDPSCHPDDAEVLTAEQSKMREDAGRSHAQSELSSCVPPWVELAIL